jgi:hypothetical protein
VLIVDGGGVNAREELPFPFSFAAEVARAAGPGVNAVRIVDRDICVDAVAAGLRAKVVSLSLLRCRTGTAEDDDDVVVAPNALLRKRDAIEQYPSSVPM